MKSKIKLNESAALTILTQAMVNNSPIKVAIDGQYDPHFGNVREIGNDYIVIEHFDYTQTVAIKNITDIIN